MSTRSPPLDQTTHLFLGGLDDTDGPIVIVDDRAVGYDGCGIAVLIDDARL